MKPILEIKNISKRYKINRKGGPGYLSMRDSVMSFFNRSNSSKEDFWALKNVSFDINPGDSIGIIGKNGAGKSTLLKILSRITPPTEGKIISRGRIASLLEVGTGFHPELTGRENIFLNGSILGLQKVEILKHLDSIIDFSGVEKFLDTQLKFYSSGMQLRLAFAVAAHLEPEILIIDEVLAVGDAEFQKRCIGKMSEVSKSGRTIIFVSHQMGLISTLCSKSVLLNGGHIENSGNTRDIIDQYFLLNGNKISKYIAEDTAKEIFISEAVTINKEGKETDSFEFDKSVFLKISIVINNPNPLSKFSCTLQSKNGYYLSTLVEDIEKLSKGKNNFEFIVKFPERLIAPNRYMFRLAIFIPNRDVFDLQESICNFEIIDNGTPMALFEGVDYGNVILNYEII